MGNTEQLWTRLFPEAHRQGCETPGYQPNRTRPAVALAGSPSFSAASGSLGSTGHSVAFQLAFCSVAQWTPRRSDQTVGMGGEAPHSPCRVVGSTECLQLSRKPAGCSAWNTVCGYRRCCFPLCPTACPLSQQQQGWPGLDTLGEVRRNLSLWVIAFGNILLVTGSHMVCFRSRMRRVLSLRAETPV